MAFWREARAVMTGRLAATTARATAPVAHQAPAVPDGPSLVMAPRCSMLETGAWPTRGAMNARPLVPASTQVPATPAAVTRADLDAFVIAPICLVFVGPRLRKQQGKQVRR